MSRSLDYSDFTTSGYRDCANVFDTSSHYDAWERLGKPRGAGVAAKVVREAWDHYGDQDIYDAWLTKSTVDAIVKHGLDPRAAYKAWRNGWQACAEGSVASDMKEWIREEEEDR